MTSTNTTAVFPWTTEETAFLKKVIVEHPGWDNTTIFNQFVYEFPNQKHTQGAMCAKLTTLRPSQKTGKWDAKAHKKLAQMLKHEVPRADIAKYFGVSTIAISHQTTRVKNIGLLKKTRTRKINPFNRLNVERSESKSIVQPKQLDLGIPKIINPIKVVTANNKIAAQVKAISTSVENLTSKPKTASELQKSFVRNFATVKPRTTTEIGIIRAEQERQWSGTTQELIVHNIVNILGRALQLLEN